MTDVCFSALDDEALVIHAREGNHEAFEELWERYFQRVLQTVHRITKNPSDAEDALQDTFLSAFTHLNNFQFRAKFSTWLMRIAMNSALMILRRRRSHPQASLYMSIDGETWEEWDIPDQSIDIESSYARHEATVELKAAIGRLRPALRTVVQIHNQNEGTLKETATLAGLSVPATKTRLARARGVLRQRLARLA